MLYCVRPCSCSVRHIQRNFECLFLLDDFGPPFKCAIILFYIMQSLICYRERRLRYGSIQHVMILILFVTVSPLSYHGQE